MWRKVEWRIGNRGKGSVGRMWLELMKVSRPVVGDGEDDGEERHQEDRHHHRGRGGGGGGGRGEGRQLHRPVYNLEIIKLAKQQDREMTGDVM